jgi:hypothetical protein
MIGLLIIFTTEALENAEHTVQPAAAWAFSIRTSSAFVKLCAAVDAERLSFSEVALDEPQIVRHFLEWYVVD